MAEAFAPGQPVTWLHEMRGGYGYVERIPAEVVRTTTARVLIQARKKSGELAQRWVRPEHLRPRKEDPTPYAC